MFQRNRKYKDGSLNQSWPCSTKETILHVGLFRALIYVFCFSFPLVKRGVPKRKFVFGNVGCLFCRAKSQFFDRAPHKTSNFECISSRFPPTEQHSVVFWEQTLQMCPENTPSPRQFPVRTDAATASASWNIEQTYSMLRVIVNAASWSLPSKPANKANSSNAHHSAQIIVVPASPSDTRGQRPTIHMEMKPCVKVFKFSCTTTQMIVTWRVRLRKSDDGH